MGDKWTTSGRSRLQALQKRNGFAGGVQRKRSSRAQQPVGPTPQPHSHRNLSTYSAQDHPCFFTHSAILGRSECSAYADPSLRRAVCASRESSTAYQHPVHHSRRIRDANQRRIVAHYNPQYNPRDDSVRHVDYFHRSNGRISQEIFDHPSSNRHSVFPLTSHASQDSHPRHFDQHSEASRDFDESYPSNFARYSFEAPYNKHEQQSHYGISRVQKQNRPHHAAPDSQSLSSSNIAVSARSRSGSPQLGSQRHLPRHQSRSLEGFRRTNQPRIPFRDDQRELLERQHGVDYFDPAVALPVAVASPEYHYTRPMELPQNREGHSLMHGPGAGLPHDPAQGYQSQEWFAPPPGSGGGEHFHHGDRPALNAAGFGNGILAPRHCPGAGALLPRSHGLETGARNEEVVDVDHSQSLDSIRGNARLQSSQGKSNGQGGFSRFQRSRQPESSYHASSRAQHTGFLDSKANETDDTPLIPRSRAGSSTKRHPLSPRGNYESSKHARTRSPRGPDCRPRAQGNSHRGANTRSSNPDTDVPHLTISASRATSQPSSSGLDRFTNMPSASSATDEARVKQEVTPRVRVLQGLEFLGDPSPIRLFKGSVEVDLQTKPVARSHVGMDAAGGGAGDDDGSLGLRGRTSIWG